MGEKLVAGIVTAAAIAPVCAVCILGPAAIGSLFAGAFGWLGGFGPLATIAFMIAAGAGILVARDFSRRKMRTPHSRDGYFNGASHVAATREGGSRIPDSRSDAANGQLHRPSHSR